MNDTKHAVYGPSSLKYRRICAGWRNDRDADLTYANEGTAMHASAETGIRGVLTDDQWREVKKCLNFIAAYERGADQVFKELRLDILNGLTFGTADRVTISGRKAIIIDFKFGRGFIDDAEINMQGWAYAVGVFERFDVDEVEVIFIIPRRDEVSSHTFTSSDLPRLRTEIRRVIERCIKFDASIDPVNRTCDETLLNKHDEACQYCGFIARCPKHQQTAIEVAAKYAPLEVVEETHSSAISDPAQMAKTYAVARIMEKWAASVKKHAMEMANTGVELPGFEVRERAGNREINNPVLAYNVLIQSGLDPIEIITAAKLSLSGIEKLVSDRAPRGQKAKSVATLNAALSEADAITSGEPIRYLQKVRE